MLKTSSTAWAKLRKGGVRDGSNNRTKYNGKCKLDRSEIGDGEVDGNEIDDNDEVWKNQKISKSNKIFKFKKTVGLSYPWN